MNNFLKFLVFLSATKCMSLSINNGVSVCCTVCIFHDAGIDFGKCKSSIWVYQKGGQRGSLTTVWEHTYFVVYHTSYEVIILHMSTNKLITPDKCLQYVSYISNWLWKLSKRPSFFVSSFFLRIYIIIVKWFVINFSFHIEIGPLLWIVLLLLLFSLTRLHKA